MLNGKLMYSVGLENGKPSSVFYFIPFMFHWDLSLMSFNSILEFDVFIFI